jgi:uncharacterized protein YerC
VSRKPIPMPDEIRSILWRTSLDEIAQQAGVSTTVVIRWRAENPPSEQIVDGRGRTRKYQPQKRRSYPDEPPASVRELIGKVADGRISTETGIPTYIIRQWRISLKLPPGGWVNLTLDPKASYEAKYPGIVGLLETRPTCEVAKHFGVSAATVSNARRALGLPKIPVKQSDETRDANLERRYPGLIARLGIISDGTLAAEYKVTRAYLQLIRARLGIVAFTKQRHESVVSDPSLGKETDRQIAARYGMGPQIVGRLRRARGLPAATTRGRAIEDFTPYLGKISDRKIAASFDVPVALVQRVRDRLGIPPLRPSPASPSFVAIDQKSVLRMALEGKSNIEIADFFGANPQYIGMLLNQKGVFRKGKQGRLGKATGKRIDRDLVSKLLAEHKTYAEIAAVTGGASTTIGEIARKELGVERGTNAHKKRREALKK